MLKRIELIKNNFQQVLFVFLAFLGMVLVSYFYVSNIVGSQMMHICEGILDTTQTAVSADLLNRELTFSGISMTFEKMISSGRNNEEMLQHLREVNAFYLDEQSSLPDFMKIYGYIRGEFLDGLGWIPPDDYDARTRPWYEGAVNNDGKVFFSEPYVDAQTGEQVISFSQVIIDASDYFYGVLAIDLNLTRITDYIRHQSIANNGYGIFITNNLIIASHSNSALIGMSMNEAGGDYPLLADMLMNHESITAKRFTDSNGVDSIAFFRTIFNGWHIGVITPRIYYYNPVNNLAFVLGIMGFLFMVSLSYLLVKTRIEQMKSDEESKSKSTFLARMSHEMRTPMNAIIGMTQIAGNSSDPLRIRYCLGKINDASVHLLGVINDVLDMSKIEAGKLELINADFNLREMMAAVSNVVNYKIDEKSQQFSIHVAEEVPAYINSDKQLLSQVISNLLTNANKFTPIGGKIEVTVDLLQVNQDKYVIQFSVKDSGIGISKEQQLRLFQSFEQADGSISRKYGGTGLGLVISKRIVEMMGGTIRLESEEDRGARFVVTVTAGKAVNHSVHEQGRTSLEAETEMPVGEFDFSGKHILLTEDVEINREIILSLLESTHAVIDCAKNGMEACEMFACNPEKYDLIFMDIHMPEMDGYEAVRKIRAMEHDKAKTVPIIAMTADVFRDDIEKMFKAGMNDHIGKPVELSEIIRKMRKYIIL